MEYKAISFHLFETLVDNYCYSEHQIVLNQMASILLSLAMTE